MWRRVNCWRKPSSIWTTGNGSVTRWPCSRPRLLSQLGRDAGGLAASALPPLIEQLGIMVSDDLLTRQMRDLQVMGWATLEQASIEDASRGEVVPGRHFRGRPVERGS